MSLEESILSKITLKEVGIYISNYADLFVRPKRVWKKIVLQDEEGYNLIILHLIYYTTFAVLLGIDFHNSISFALIDAAVVIIPFMAFILPFLVFARWFKTNQNWTTVFRLMLILKLQFFPILYILNAVINVTKAEGLYIITDNIIVVVSLCFIIVFPVMTKLRFWQKLIWVATNYIFFFFYIYLISSFIYKVDNENKFASFLLLSTPNTEYVLFKNSVVYTQGNFDITHCILRICLCCR